LAINEEIPSGSLCLKYFLGCRLFAASVKPKNGLYLQDIGGQPSFFLTKPGGIFTKKNLPKIQVV